MKFLSSILVISGFSLFFGCSLLVSFDEPKKNGCNADFPDCELPECAEHPDCLAIANCTMNPPDCRLPSCQEHEKCQKVDDCTVQFIFYDSPPACNDGYKCSPTGLTSVDCVQEIFFSDGKFYEPCNNLGYCPHGSFCLKHKSGASQVGFVPGAELCIPFCHLTSHPRCPGARGECVHLEENPMMDICFSNDQCDPVMDSGCPAGKSCYLFNFEGAMCVKGGTMDRRRPCQFNWDCKPGHICVDHGQTDWGVCAQLCREPEDCGELSIGCYRTGELGICAFDDDSNGK